MLISSFYTEASGLGMCPLHGNRRAERRCDFIGSKLCAWNEGHNWRDYSPRGVPCYFLGWSAPGNGESPKVRTRPNISVETNRAQRPEAVPITYSLSGTSGEVLRRNSE